MKEILLFFLPTSIYISAKEKIGRKNLLCLLLFKVATSLALRSCFIFSINCCRSSVLNIISFVSFFIQYIIKKHIEPLFVCHNGHCQDPQPNPRHDLHRQGRDFPRNLFVFLPLQFHSVHTISRTKCTRCVMSFFHHHHQLLLQV